MKIQNKLLDTSGLTFNMASQIAISMELADKNSLEFSRQNSGVGQEATSSVRVKTTDKEEPSVRSAMVTSHLSLVNLRMQHAIDVRKSDMLLWCVKNGFKESQSEQEEFST